MLTNSETESLGFIQITTVKQSWKDVFKPAITAAYGYSIEVFRGRHYIGSVAVEDQSMANQMQQQLKLIKVNSGDTLIWVSLADRQVEMHVPLTTRENNYPVCRLTMMLRVDKSRARDFANDINQNKDPVQVVKPLIANELKRYVIQRSYDELDDHSMRYKVMQSLYGGNKRYGLVIEDVVLSLQPDEHIARRILLNQEANTNALQDKVDQERQSQRNEFVRREEILQSRHRREEQSQDRAGQRRQELLDSYGRVIQEELPKRLRRDLNSGKSKYHLEEEYPEIQDYFAPAKQSTKGTIAWEERARLAADTTREMSRRPDDADLLEEEEVHVSGLSRHKVDVFVRQELGIAILRAQLSEEQRTLAGIQMLSAMLVCQVDDGTGPFAVGDLILMIGGVAASDILIMPPKDRPLALLSARILRGSSLVDVEIRSIQ